MAEVKKEPVQKFRGQWSNPFPPEGLDCSNEYVDTYLEIPPFTKNEKGEILNDTDLPKFVKNGKINIQERIQSYAQDCDIYTILERFANSGDTSLINARNAQYGDITNLPDNLNDMDNYISNQFEQFSDLDSTLKDAILSEASTDSVAKDYVEKVKADNEKAVASSSQVVSEEGK